MVLLVFDRPTRMVPGNHDDCSEFWSARVLVMSKVPQPGNKKSASMLIPNGLAPVTLTAEIAPNLAGIGRYRVRVTCLQVIHVAKFGQRRKKADHS